MLKILYIQGTIDGTFPLDPTELTGDAVADRSLAYVTKFKAGSIVKIGADGYIALAADKDLGVGILVNDAAGYDFENIPALASGMAPAIIGGCVVETDNVADTDLTAGIPLYVVAGVLQKTDPGTGIPVALTRSANSASDKTVRIQVL